MVVFEGERMIMRCSYVTHFYLFKAEGISFGKRGKTTKERMYIRED